MALTIYPTTDWDSYITISETTTLLTENVLDTSNWTNLTEAHQEIYLRQTSNLIRLRISDPHELSTPSDLALATVLLANYSIGKDMSTSDGSNNLKIKDLSGVIKKEWFGPSRASNSFPDYVSSLLEQYGFVSYGSLSLDRS